MSHEPDRHAFYAVCRDCGSVTDASRDNQFCACGGVYHVDSVRCLA